MRMYLFFVCFFVTATVIHGQPAAPDPRVATLEKMERFRTDLQQEKTDTGRLQKLLRMGRGFLQLGLPDSQLVYAQKALALAQKLNNPKAESVASFLVIWAYRHTGRYPQALQAAFANLRRAEEAKDTATVIEALRHVMFTYAAMQEYRMVLSYARRSQKLVHSGAFKDDPELNHLALAGYLNFMGGAFEGLQQFDSALHYRTLAYRTALLAGDRQDLAVTTRGLGNCFLKRTQYDSAVFYFHRCLAHVKEASFRADLAADAQLGLAKIHREQDHPDSATFYASLALQTAHQIKNLAIETEAASLLHLLYANRPLKDSAYKYLMIATTLKDSLFNTEKIKETENIKYAEALRLQKLEQQAREAKQQYQTRLKTYGIAGAVVFLLLLGFFVYRLRRLRHEKQLTSVFNKKIYQLEMRALRAQMNPHFIFNCLNSINRYIVKSDHATASDYLSKFARLIRFILDNSAAENITLDKEIQTLQLYMDMEVLRFDHAFSYSVEVDEGLWPEAILIPSMLLQPYVENAIWHGLLHKESGNGKICIRFRQAGKSTVIAEVEDNGIGRKKAKEAGSKEALRKKSYGMQITSDRIFLLNELYDTNANVQIEDLTDKEGVAQGTKVTVTIPVRDL